MILISFKNIDVKQKERQSLIFNDFHCVKTVFLKLPRWTHVLGGAPLWRGWAVEQFISRNSARLILYYLGI